MTTKVCSGKKPLHQNNPLSQAYQKTWSLQHPRMQPDNRPVHAVHQPRPPNRQQDDGFSHQERASHNTHLPNYVHHNYCISQFLLHTTFSLHTLLNVIVFMFSKPIVFCPCSSLHISTLPLFIFLVYSALKSVDLPTGLLLTSSEMTS